MVGLDAPKSIRKKMEPKFPFYWQWQGVNLFHLTTLKSTKKKKKKREQGCN
jgi:hypothetical protein